MTNFRTVITLTLLHPTQSVPVQSWSFESESVVRIGRATDNDVIIYSAVVSRHHVELWNNPSGWEIINFGANGTYVDDRVITQVPLVDGMMIRLGSSGPKIRVRIEVADSETKRKTPFSRRLSGSLTADAAQKRESLISRRSRIEKEEAIIYTDEGLTQTDFE
ncbi:FHA domain-containing protein [Kamptonema sp. UHCC 0994]|uniref:FHA domain-containing protein n=1 Tax=Kamptonema sp. UHCC 0994 TaxID=3031329 RepID=UPI0031BA8246